MDSGWINGWWIKYDKKSLFEFVVKIILYFFKKGILNKIYIYNVVIRFDCIIYENMF